MHYTNSRRVFAALLLCVFAISANAAVIVAAGDSQTNRYYPYMPAGTLKVAVGGLRSTHFDGSTAQPPATTPTDYTAQVLADDPDAICFLLGINEAYLDAWAPSTFDGFKAHMGGIFDRFDAYTNGRGVHPMVVLGTLPEMDNVRNLAVTGNAGTTGCNDRIANWYNPWLLSQASERGYTVVDLWATVHQDPATLLSSDGLHFSPAGSMLVAQQFAAAVPEPTMPAVMAGLGAVVALRRRRAA